MNAIEQIKRDEGFRAHPYRDSVGKWSIGYGRNLEDVGISQVEGDYLLQNDIDWAEHHLDVNLTWWRGLEEVRRAVLLNMTFNMGIGGLMGFRQMLKALQDGDYEGAAREMLDSKWAEQVGARANRLAEQLRIGEWV